MEYDLRMLANYDSTLAMNLERLVHYSVNGILMAIPSGRDRNHVLRIPIL